MPEDVPVAELLRIERGCAEPEEVAAIAVVVACLVGQASQAAPVRPPASARPHRPGARRATGCWAGCWSC
ncbi:acyl-CoA carboxylase epsilon subunit [Streptomyces antimicrobicus]|uniref:Acyl-CoA carboxylase subunit epsilon n=1 Tax=Streptomyces antimicrobicus TaxID=2883108 RepID=A0ABS8BB35_9ACTN|nr:acyl-CoA carboxylase epsilon subunit [Streptomyces antimicrobicus]MCB5181825.1 acyl-CoA carboxylase subunit epsilon [Streptomyces antimicrobicus]